MLIPLICKQCGGKLEIEESRIIKSDDMFIVLNGEIFKCPHCGVNHLQGEKLKQMAPASVGQIYISGSINGGSFVIGNNNVVVHPLSKPATSPDKPLPSELSESKEDDV